jgi:hypothetical protein
MLIKPTDLFCSNIGCCTVPDLTIEQYVKLQDRQEVEVSEASAKYLIDYGYGTLTTDATVKNTEIKNSNTEEKEGV